MENNKNDKQAKKTHKYNSALIKFLCASGCSIAYLIFIVLVNIVLSYAGFKLGWLVSLLAVWGLIATVKSIWKKLDEKQTAQFDTEIATEENTEPQDEVVQAEQNLQTQSNTAAVTSKKAELKKHKGSTIAIWCLSTVLAVSLFLNVFIGLGLNNSENEFCDYKAKTEANLKSRENEIERLENEKKKLLDERKDNLENEREINFFENMIVFIVDDDDTYYHTYNCQQFKNCKSYHAFNYSLAENRGYRACPECKTFSAYTYRTQN